MLKSMPLLLLLKLAPMLALLVCAACIDVRTRKIPNWLTFGLLAGGIGRAIVFGGHGATTQALIGMVAGAAIPMIMFAMSAMGAGDVKMMAAIGAWVGWQPVLVIYLLEKVVGMVIILVQATYQGKTALLFRNSTIVAMNFAMAGETGLQRAIDEGKEMKSVDRPLPVAVPTLIATMLVLWIGSAFGR
jgi:prepilin peptidase CpaA